jgi:hypothetical protein
MLGIVSEIAGDASAEPHAEWHATEIAPGTPISN